MSEVAQFVAPSAEFLSPEDILNSDDREILSVKIPEWKGKVRFKAMPASDAMVFQDNLTGPTKRSALIKLFQLCAVKDDDTPLFSPNQISSLVKKSWPVFLRLQKPLMQLNGFLQPDKSLITVKTILSTAGVEDDVIRKVEELWKEDDEDIIKND